MDMCESGGGRSGWTRMVMAFTMLSIAAMGLVGCNAGGNNLLEANRALQERVTALQAENESLNNTNQQLQAALSARDKAMLDLQMQLDSMMSSGKGMDEKYNDMLARLKGMKFGSLDPQTDAALRDLAAQHPDMLEYDPVSGVLRFKSDVTFASGSDEVNASARPTLQQLASILNSAALAYDIKVMGHTDSQPISRNKARHPTNMHLSAHRAISVRTDLVGMGVAAQRFEVAGRGEFEPMVSNNANGNTPRNRRVEVYLTRATGRSVGGPSGDAMPSPSAPIPAPRPRAAPREDIMK